MGEIHFRADRLFSWDLGIECSLHKVSVLLVIWDSRDPTAPIRPKLILLTLTGTEEKGEREYH
jgi:hypothetical protein